MDKVELLRLLNDDVDVRHAVSALLQHEQTALVCGRCHSPNLVVAGNDPAGLYRCMVCQFRGWDHRAAAMWDEGRRL